MIGYMYVNWFIYFVIIFIELMCFNNFDYVWIMYVYFKGIKYVKIVL